MSDARPLILLVDDDRDILKLVSMRLNASGYEVQAVDSGHMALAALAASRPRLVITREHRGRREPNAEPSWQAWTGVRSMLRSRATP